MKKINKLIGLLLVLVSFITLASCSGTAGVKAIMEAKATTSKVTLTCTFEANSKLESGEAYPIIRQYSYENGEVKDTSDAYKKLTFDKSNTVTSAVFDGLDSNTKYLFKMYINYDSSDTYLTEIEVTTLSYDEEKPIEINSKADFLNMEDDADGIYVLKTDIDFDGDKLDLFDSADNPFKGTLNGDGHKLSNFQLSTNSVNYYGVFGYTKNAKISNLKIENVTVESNGKGSFALGTLVGCAESTTVTDVTIKDVNYEVTVATNGDVNIGGVVGNAINSSFNNTSIENITIDFAQVKFKTNVGLFAGRFSGSDSTTTMTIRDKDGNDKERKILTYQCSAVGEIKGDMKFTSSTDGYLRAGGFVGFVEASSSLIYNSYCSAKITFTKTDSTDKYDLSVGGFLGSNTGSVNISRCFAKTDIQVCASEVSVTSETAQQIIDEMNDNRLVAVDSDKTASIGGFSGRFNTTIGEISNCYFTGSVDVYAKATRNVPDAERTDIASKIKTLHKDDSVVVNGIEYLVTDETEYYVKENDTYTKVDDVNEDNFSSNTYYVKSGDSYEIATEYTKKELVATYLVVGEMVGINTNSADHIARAIRNVVKYQSTSDTSIFDTFVKTFVDSINA